jgi:hypothetical protein
MQIDMHYYGTFAMARCAGLKSGVCRIIATAAQFVDDNAADAHIEFRDGGRIDAQPTAHHVSDIISHLDPEDQRQVWVPFHFLPGNRGRTFSERLICRKDTPIVREMINHSLTYAKTVVGPYLVGIAAHACADTYSHHGFSGVSSRRNRVDNGSIEFESGLTPDTAHTIRGKAEDFFRRYGPYGGLMDNIKSWLAEIVSGALGHGAVATYPDRPYLKWRFAYEYPERILVKRDNPADFFKGCRALHQTFFRLGRKNPALTSGSPVPFSAIGDSVRTILACQGSREERIDAWRRASWNGRLGKRFRIVSYHPELWREEAEDLSGSRHSESALIANIYRFYQAASLHRQFVLRELLPGHGLVVA